MSFINDLATYIAANTSLEVDTDLFVGAEVLTAPTDCDILTELSGANESESGLISHPIQVMSKALSYAAAQTRAYVIYDLLKHQPGYSTLSDVFYCDVMNMPFMISRDQRGNYIFCTNFLFRRS